MAMDMKTSTRQTADITIVDVSGKIALGEESAALRNLVMDLLSEGHHKILLNLAGVHYIDSSGLGALVSAMASVRKVGGEMKLTKLTEKVDDLMEVTRLYTVFDIADDEASAVSSFRRGTAAGA
jgi:anti-sigma B factor antagonist